MRAYTPDIPAHVAATVRQLPPDLKRGIKQALRAISADPDAGEPLRRDLEGLLRYSVRRFRIVYRPDRTRRVIQVLAVGHRRDIYEQVADVLKRQQKP